VNSPQTFLAASGLVLLSSVSCAPAPAATAHSAPPSTPVAIPAATTAAPSCADESVAEELVDKGLQIERISADEALAFYEQARALAPNNARIQYRIGTIYRKKEDWDKAVASFSRAVALEPSFANYWLWYGYSLDIKARKEGKGWDEARKALEKCIEIDPNYAECHHRLAEVCLRLDDERQALESYTKAIRIEPTKIDRYPALADLYLNLDFVEEADVVLKQAKQFAKPGDRSLFWVHVLSFQVQQMRGAANAIVELEAAKAVSAGEEPQATQILFMLGSSYAVLKPPRRAEAIANLKAFAQRACKGSKSALYPIECMQTQSLITKLGGAQP